MPPELIVYALIGLLVLCAVVVGIVLMLRKSTKPRSGSNGMWFLGDDGSDGGGSGGE